MFDLTVIFALVYPALSGVFSGLLIAALGYFKSTPDVFEPRKFFITVGIGAIVGAVAGYLGMEYASAEAWLGSIGAITAIDYILKAIWRRYLEKKALELASPAKP